MSYAHRAQSNYQIRQRAEFSIRMGQRNRSAWGAVRVLFIALALGLCCAGSGWLMSLGH